MTFLHALSCSSRPLGSRNRIVPGVPRPLALEARFMFDGAAAAEVVDAVAEPSADCDDGLRPLTSPSITQAYAVDTDETPGTRNQNSHTFTNGAITVKSIEVDTDPGDGFGNDILASITLVIDGKDTTYFGWISRQIKDGKETQGLYFWTDPSFTSGQAALDGYKDQIKDPDKNNPAFILALGTTWEGAAGRSFTEKSSSDIKTEDWETDACDEPDNRAPMASSDSASSDEDTPLSGNVLANDADPDGDALSVTGFRFIDPSSGSIVQSQPGASVAIGNAGDFSLNADGRYTFTPALHYNGTLPDITYTVSDPGNLSVSAILSLTINPVNDAPVARNDSQSENEDTEMTGNVLSNDDDPDGVPPQVTGFSFIDPGTEEPVQGQPGVPVDIGKSGTFTLNTDGSYTFTPRSDYNGSVPIITYTVTDAGNLEASADLSLTVKPVNDAPTSTDDTATTNESTSLVLSASDFGDFADVDGDGLQAVHITARPTTGTLQRYDDGNWRALVAGESVFSVNDLTNGHLRFVPGTADTSLQFRVSDGTSLSAATYTLTLNVTRTVSPVPTPEPMPAPPTAPTPPGSPPAPAPAPAPSPDPLPSDPAPAVQAIVIPAPPSASARGLFLPPPSAQPIVLDIPGRGHTLQVFDSTLYPHRASASMGATYLIEPSHGHTLRMVRSLAPWAANDSYTDASENDWRVAVHPDTRSDIAVWRGVPDQVVNADGVTHVSIPWDSFSHTHSDARVTLDATLADGSPLPPWMNLDTRSGVFEFVPPPGLAVELAIRLIVRDAEGREAATLFRIQVGERERAISDGATPTGRTGLSEQLREATRQSSASRLALPPQYMTAPAPHFASHPS